MAKFSFSLNLSLLHAKELALQHGCNAANEKFIRVHEADISSREVHNLKVWYGAAYFGTLFGIFGPTSSDQLMVCCIETVLQSGLFRIQ